MCRLWFYAPEIEKQNVFTMNFIHHHNSNARDLNTVAKRVHCLYSALGAEKATNHPCCSALRQCEPLYEP